MREIAETSLEFYEDLSHFELHEFMSRGPCEAQSIERYKVGDAALSRRIRNHQLKSFIGDSKQ